MLSRPFLSGSLVSLLLAASSVTSHAIPSTTPSQLLIRDDGGGINSNTSQACTNCTNLGNFNDPLPVYDSDPTVKVLNGTYAGIRLDSVDANDTFSGIGVKSPQDLFLGIPYAQQPSGERRFKRPERLGDDHSWQETRSAKRYSEHCYSVGTDNNYLPPYVTYKLGEECLTLNVVRPANVTESDKLPVWVWIHGGGFVSVHSSLCPCLSADHIFCSLQNYGGSGDTRYNASWIVDDAVQTGNPFIFASLNYRTGLLGFPLGDEANSTGVFNLGLYDQRLALNWIKENIASFGGDPEKVTIIGESAGGASMFFHLSAYGGRDDHLFRGVLSESGYWATTPIEANTTAIQNTAWSAFLNATSCLSGDTQAHFDCLRSLPSEQVKTAINSTDVAKGNWNPTVDGDIVQKDLQRSFLDGDFVKSANLLVMANLDEGISFGPKSINTTDDLRQALAGNGIGSIPKAEARSQSAQDAVLQAYPEGEDAYPPYHAGDGLLMSGKMDRRSAGIFGDLVMLGPKRAVAQALSANQTGGAQVYNARFEQVPYPGFIISGTPHFIEVPYVFKNPLDTQNPLGDKPRDLALAEEMASYWRSFVVTGNPSTLKCDSCPEWPAYSSSDRQMMTLSKAYNGRNNTVVTDDDRVAGMQMLADIRSGAYQPAQKRGHSEL